MKHVVPGVFNPGLKAAPKVPIRRVRGSVDEPSMTSARVLYRLFSEARTT